MSPKNYPNHKFFRYLPKLGQVTISTKAASFNKEPLYDKQKKTLILTEQWRTSRIIVKSTFGENVALIINYRWPFEPT